MAQTPSCRSAIVLALVLSLGVAAPAAPSFAKNAGGDSAAHMSGEATANSNGPHAVDRDHGKDRAGDRAHHVKTNANSNGKKAVDRDKGRDRAADRDR
jgi:hypothetical protein